MQNDGKNSVEEILKILYTCERAMPAHFTSYKDRKQSFCIDFEGLTADDDYQLASESYHSVYEFASKIPEDQIAKAEIICMLRIGEDLTIGSFMLQRTDRYTDFFSFRDSVIKDNLDMFENTPLDHVVKLQMMQNYFDYCVTIGRARADKLIEKK
jgi:hypothetical protein